jgi:holo-[acyl-carrier protein] synthase
MPGAGIDLLEIDRLERALERRPRLADRLFTPRELDYARARARPAQHLAARFCAKEAVAKALRLDAWSWQDIEVVEGPSVVLHGALADRGAQIDVSLTHSRTMAGAVAVLR